MNWLWGSSLAIGGLIVGFYTGFYIAQTSVREATLPTIRQLERAAAYDRNSFLRTLRRELSNWMLRTDPDRYLRVYRQVHQAVMEIRTAERNDQINQSTELGKKYPFYSDFDLLGTRQYVLYDDAISSHSYEDVERHFSDIVRFHALQIALYEEWKGFHATSTEELVHLEGYVERYRDTIFKSRLIAAVREFFNHKYFQDYEEARKNAAAPAGSRVISEQSDASGDSAKQVEAWLRDVALEQVPHLHEGRALYDTPKFSVCPVHHVAEDRYGFHFKDTDEFGLYGRFYGDGEKIYESFYRSNS